MVSIAVSLRPPVDVNVTYGWLMLLNLPAATERLVVAAQNQAFRTRYYERNFCIVMSVPLAA